MRAHVTGKAAVAAAASSAVTALLLHRRLACSRARLARYRAGTATTSTTMTRPPASRGGVTATTTAAAAVTTATVTMSRRWASNRAATATANTTSHDEPHTDVGVTGKRRLVRRKNASPTLSDASAAAQTTTTTTTATVRRGRPRRHAASTNTTTSAAAADGATGEHEHTARTMTTPTTEADARATTEADARATTEADARATTEANAPTTTATGTAVDGADESVAVTTLSDDDVDDFVRVLHEEAQARERRVQRERERLLCRRRPTQQQQQQQQQQTASACDSADDDARNSGVEADVLTPEQQQAIDLALQGRNVFITGGAGTGKSLVLRELTLRLRERGRGDGKAHTVYVTATTGVAALNVRGATINSFAGVGYAQGTRDELLATTRRSRRACGRLRYCTTLIIDEISMATPTLFDALDYIARHIRKQPQLPFGGMQVILCGDFLQLPPIVRASEHGVRRRTPHTLPTHEDDNNNNNNDDSNDEQPSTLQYCFQTRAWRELDLCVVLLQHKHRQGGDAVFQRVLDDVRVGKLSLQSYKLLSARTVTHDNALAAAGALTAATTTHKDDKNNSSKSDDADAASRMYVRLCGTNKEVDARNSKHFAELEPRTSPKDTTQRVATTADAAVTYDAVLDATAAADDDNRSSTQDDGNNANDDDDGDDDAQRPLHVYTSYDVVYDVQRGGSGERVGHVVPPHSSHALSRNESFDRRGSGRAAASGRDSVGGGRGSGGGGGGAAVAHDTRNAAGRFEDSNLPTHLPLKVGTRVMLLQNVSTRLGVVNGSVGKVSGFLHALEMLELLRRVAVERARNALSPRTRALLRRGGFGGVQDVCRCVDTLHGQSLYWWLRQQQQQQLCGAHDGNALPYQRVYGVDHLRDVQRLVGLDEVVSVDGDTLSSLSARADDATAAAGSSDSSSGTDVDNDDDKGNDSDDVVALLDDMAAAAAATRVRASSSSSSSSSRVHVTLETMLPLHLRLTRLPIVRIDLPQHATQLLRTTTTTTTTMTTMRKWPSYVYAFVSPIQQRWYMGSEVVAMRTQLPLRHAWAITVHKSQGLTIAQLEVDMRRFSTPGQTYVALSRATSLDSVKLLNFAPENIRACPVACAYYADLQRRACDAHAADTT